MYLCMVCALLVEIVDMNFYNQVSAYIEMENGKELLG